MSPSCTCTTRMLEVSTHQLCALAAVYSPDLCTAAEPLHALPEQKASRYLRRRRSLPARALCAPRRGHAARQRAAHRPQLHGPARGRRRAQPGRVHHLVEVGRAQAEARALRRARAQAHALEAPAPRPRSGHAGAGPGLLGKENSCGLAVPCSTRTWRLLCTGGGQGCRGTGSCAAAMCREGWGGCHAGLSKASRKP